MVKFGPQSIVERAYEEIEEDPDGGETAQLTTPTAAALAGESRLAFRMPGAVTSIRTRWPGCSAGRGRCRAA